MTEGYLQIMVESLEKKINVLDEVLELNKQQLQLAATPSMDMRAYDELMEQKGALIEELNKLDEGFTTTFEMIKDDVKANQEKYKKLVLKMQDLIRVAVEKGVEVETQEKRNKEALVLVFQRKRQEVKQLKVSNSVASKYYRAMSRINDVDPQLMDRKK